jgi:hypothetical protein
MKRSLILSLLAVAGLSLGCRQSTTDTGRDLALLQKEIIEKQELLLQIHLDLDSAATGIADAQQAARDGRCETAAYDAAEAYRMLERADQAILDLGRDLQVLFDLDRRE